MIAVAVEEQSAAAREISRNVQMACRGAAQVGSASTCIRARPKPVLRQARCCRPHNHCRARRASSSLKSTISWPIRAA
jgi:hypothetical protein